jgi:DNA repair protein RadD
VDGELAEVTASPEMARWRGRPLREVLREATDADLPAIAKARGYKPGWIFHQRQARAQRASA